MATVMKLVPRRSARGGLHALGSIVLVAACLLAMGGAASFPASAEAASCGTISSPVLAGYSSTHVFTYKYTRCRGARGVLVAYLRRIGRIRHCSQNGCAKRVAGWKCRSPQVHGTLVGCVPKGSSWNGFSRPFIGVSGY